MLSRIVLLCAGLAAVAAAAGCASSDASDGRTVVAAFYPLAYAAEQVGAGVRVENLTPPGAEPHDLELGARDIGRLREAALVVYAGGGFQPAVEDAVEQRDGPSLDVLEGAAPARGDELDPHVWLDPIRYAAVARRIAGALGDAAAADDLATRLRALDARFRQGLERCERRELVTSHAAFGYLAERYGLVQVPLVGVAPEAEPSPQELERLVGRVRGTGATTVFAEPLASSALASTVAREAGAVTGVLDPLEGLTSGEVEDGADYFSVMEANLAALREALACT